jgi:hypothetical protein
MFLKVLQLNLCDLTAKSGDIFHPLETFLVIHIFHESSRTVPNNETECNVTNLVQYIYFFK